MTNYSTMAFLASEEVRAISCVFTEEPGRLKGVGTPKHYTYKTLDKSIKIDDLVVVECSGPSNYFGYCVVKVVEVDIDPPLTGNTIYKWIIGLVDLEEHKKTLTTEKTIIKEIRKLELNAGRSKLRQALGLAEDAVLKLTNFNGK